MNRKFKAIFLLLIFSVILVHEMIPHHHHDEIAHGDGSLHQHTEGVYHTNNLANIEHLTCNMHDELKVDENHECPHRYYNCTVNNLDYNTPRHSELAKQGNQNSNFITILHTNIYKIYRVCSEYSHLSIAFHYKKLLETGAALLRAPPTVG